MSARPFFLAPTARKPDTEVNDVTATLGGPIVRDKLHFYGAYEFVDRSLITGGQVITVTPANAAAARASRCRRAASSRRTRRSTSRFGKTDYQINAPNRLVGALLPLQELLRVEHRRRPDDAGSRHRLHRSDGLGLGAADVDHRRVDAQRAARAVRAAAPVPHASAIGRRRPGDHGHAASPSSAARASATATRSASTSTRASGR